MPQRDDLLWRTVFSLSDKDPVPLFETFEGILITGSPRSGKSSAVGKNIAYGLLSIPNSGALILTAKSEETENWLRYAHACGRSKDVILFNEKSGHTFDPIAYEWNRPEGTRGAATSRTLSISSPPWVVGQFELYLGLTADFILSY